MKKIILTSSIIFSLLLPSTLSAVGPCTAIWSFHQENIDYVYGIGIGDCDGNFRCMSEVTLAHNIASAANSVSWGLCCAQVDPLC